MEGTQYCDLQGMTLVSFPLSSFLCSLGLFTCSLINIRSLGTGDAVKQDR